MNRARRLTGVALGVAMLASLTFGGVVFAQEANTLEL